MKSYAQEVYYVLMAKLGGDYIGRIANLANLTLSPSEIKLFQSQINSIIEYIGHLNRVETQNTSPTSQTTGLEHVVRKDVCSQSLPKGKALSQAEDSYNDYFKVSLIIKNKDL